MLAFLDMLSPWHMLFFGVVALILFGNRLPEAARSLGRAVNEFKRGLKDVEEEIGKEPPADAQHTLNAPSESPSLEHPAGEATAPKTAAEKQEEKAPAPPE